MMNQNSNLFQTVKNIVSNDVLVCQTSLVEAMLQNGELAWYEEIENMYIDNGDKITALESMVDEIGDTEEFCELDKKYCDGEITDAEEIDYDKLNNKIFAFQDQIAELEQEQENPQEIYEWWAVTNWLANKLREFNQPILDNDYGTWWGRTCTGQSISMDHVMEQIAESIQ